MSAIARRIHREERGLTIVELLVTIMIGVVVISALVQVVNVTTRNSNRVAARVDANQTARPVLQRLMDQLHSACVAPKVIPIRSGSDGHVLRFTHGTGDAVTVTPVLREIAYVPNADPAKSTLTERVFNVIGGTAPDWTFSSTQTGPTRTLVRGINPVGSSGNPIFRYYRYATPSSADLIELPPPIDSQEASLTVQVALAFEVLPLSDPTNDANVGTTIADSALLRLTPAAEDVSRSMQPCS